MVDRPDVREALGDRARLLEIEAEPAGARAVSTTSRPRAAKTAASSRPMPRVPPTTTTLP